MKNKSIVLISFIAIIFIVTILLIVIKIFNNSNKIYELLYEKYGENFKIVHNSGNEYESGVLPTFKKTGYKNVVAAPVNNEEIKFNV